MQTIQRETELLAEQVLALSEQAQSVDDIVLGVSDLSERSNLLAVNAAIEAASLGDSGHGMRVIAAEIRGLADQAKQATGQVRSILGNIQKSIHTAVMQAEQSAKRVADGQQQSAVTQAAIDRLAASTRESTDAFEQIVAAIGQQQAGIEQVSQALRDIRTAGEQTSEGTRQVEKAVADMNALAAQLGTAVSRYQV
jgi:methyl-accepting chemotaxis protein